MRRRAAEQPPSFPSAGPGSPCAAPVAWAAAGVKPSSFMALLGGRDAGGSAGASCLCLPWLSAQSLWEQLCPQPCNWAWTRQTWLVLGTVRSRETGAPSSDPALVWLGGCSSAAVPCGAGGRREGAEFPATLRFCQGMSYLPIRKAVCL